MTLLALSDKKNFYAKKDTMVFENYEETGIVAVVKDFFGEFKADFIDLYIASSGENYVRLSPDNLEANIAFKQVMQKANITLVETQIDNKLGFKLNFPPEFNLVSGPDYIKKALNIAYKKCLNKKLLYTLLFSSQFMDEQRQKLYRGMFSVCSPIAILKDIHELVSEQVTPQNVLKIMPELEKLLTKMILIDRAKNTMGSLTEYLKDPTIHFPDGVMPSEYVVSYREIIYQLSLNLKDHKDGPKILGILEEHLKLAYLQASTYEVKRQDILKGIEAVEKAETLDLDRIVKLDLTDNIDKAKLDLYSDQLAFALKNISYHNYLNILPEDFYNLAWSKGLNDPASGGQGIKKMIADFNGLSNRVTNDVAYALNYHHQVNVMILYVQACKKSLDIGDFNSAHAIFAGLNHVSVGRLSYLKTLPIVKAVLEEVGDVFSFESSMKNYRKAIRVAINNNKTVVPFLGLHLKELTFSEEGNPTLLDDGKLNIEKIELLGEMYAHLDDSIAQLYRAKPMKSCLSFKRLDDIFLDEDKVYDASLQAFPKVLPDMSKCKTIQDLAQNILSKRSLPLYLSITHHHDYYTMPKVYSKLLYFLEDKLSKKEVDLEGGKLGLLLVNKLGLHAERNYMLTAELGKRVDKINFTCLEKIKVLELPPEINTHSDSNFIRRIKL